jgi:pimeloyl-ACP methyl ester carboxylesterase
VERRGLADTAKKGQELHKAIPGSQLRTIPCCFHLAQEDATATVVEHLADFFAS